MSWMWSQDSNCFSDHKNKSESEYYDVTWIKLSLMAGPYINKLVERKSGLYIYCSLCRWRFLLQVSKQIILKTIKPGSPTALLNHTAFKELAT